MLFWVITQRVVVIYYRRFVTTYRVPPSGVRDYLSLEMGQIGCPETSVRNYHYSLRNNPEERNSQPGKHLEKLGKTMQPSVRTAGSLVEIWSQDPLLQV